MKTMFHIGLGQPRQIWAVQTNSWADLIAQGIKSGSDVYGTYATGREAEQKLEMQQLDAQSNAASLRALQILQQTNAAVAANQAAQNTIMGIDKTVFFVGAAVVAAAVIFGITKAAGTKKA